MSARLRRYAVPATVVSLAVVPLLASAGLIALSSASTSRSRASGGRRNAPAASPQPKCGDTITADTTLHHDLIDCPNNGIVIGADNITLDLNGHTIDGDRTPAAGCNHHTEFCDVGVVNFGHDAVTVVHGSLRQFGAGVDFGKVRHNRLLDISASNSQAVGIQFFGSSRSVIRHSSGTGSIDPDGGTGLGLFDCHRIRVLHNSIRRNGGRGMSVVDSTRNLLMGNVLSRNKGDVGIDLEGSDRNQVRHNHSVGDRGIGIYIAPGNRNVIARNRVSHNRGPDFSGIEVDGGDHNVFARNSVRDTVKSGIAVGTDVLEGTVVRGNRIRGAGEDGVQVTPKAKHTLLRRNHAFGSKDDGLDVNNSTTKLTRNEARGNGDLGIEAVRGTNDGGGNRASGNGDKRQCVHVRCH